VSVQAVQVVQVGRVALHGGDVAADQLDGVVQCFLPPSLDEDVSAFLDEQPGAGQCHAGGSAGDHRYLAIELPTITPSGLGMRTVRELCTPYCLLNVPHGQPERKLCTPIGTQRGYTGGMTELEKGPKSPPWQGRARRILSASQQLFRDQGINRTGMDQLCAVAQVSKRTAYQHFTSKDELVAEYLRRFDPDVMPGVFDRTDLTPANDSSPLRAPVSGAKDLSPCAPTSRGRGAPRPPTPRIQYARDYKKPSPSGSPKPPAKPAPPTRTTRRTTGALLDGASARTRVLNSESFPTAAAIAAVLIDNAIKPK